MKKRTLIGIISIVLCFSLLFSITLPVTAAGMNIADILAGIIGGGSGEKINIADIFSSWLDEQINEEGPIDKLVNNIKNEWYGVKDDATDDENADKDEIVVINKAEAANIAELFNLTVNELKKANPGFTKTQTASMDAKIAQQLQGGLGVVTGLVESLIGTKDIFAGVIDGTNSSNQIRTKYNPGNDIINNMTITGKDYVASLTADDIKDYTMTIYRSGAYKMHIDLNDVEGSAADSGLANVFDTSDKAYATLNFGATQINILIMLKYVDNYVECNVNRNGEITSYTQGMGITFLFQQEDGSYGPEMPYLGVNFQEEGIIYKITTEYSGINFNARLMGDADSSGKVNSTDARMVLRYASNLDTCPEDDIPYCDVTGDGKVNAADARKILRSSARIETLPTTEESLGIKPYVKDPHTQSQIDDLLVILMAYQNAKDEAAKNELQDYYEDKYQNGNKTEEETTTKDINSTTGKVEDIIGGIGDIIGGFTGGSGSGNLFGDLFS